MINIIDLLALFCLAYGLFMGYRKGLINILFDAFALGAALLVSTHFSADVESFLKVTLKIRVMWVGMLATFITFTGSFIVMKLLGVFLTKLFSKTGLGPWNQFVGMGLNCLKWMLIVILLVLIVIRVPIKKVNYYGKKSIVYAVYQKMIDAPTIRNFIPPKLR